MTRPRIRPAPIHGPNERPFSSSRAKYVHSSRLFRSGFSGLAGIVTTVADAVNVVYRFVRTRASRNLNPPDVEPRLEPWNGELAERNERHHTCRRQWPQDPSTQNLATALDWLALGQLNVAPLIAPVGAADAYRELLEQPNEFLGIVIDWTDAQ